MAAAAALEYAEPVRHLEQYLPVTLDHVGSAHTFFTHITCARNAFGLLPLESLMNRTITCVPVAVNTFDVLDEPLRAEPT